MFKYVILFTCVYAFLNQVFASELLDWPVKLNNESHQFGANLSQFVEIGSKYFHAGQDIVASAGSEVITPVSGRIEAGYYEYRDLPTGHSEKIFYPLLETMNDLVLQTRLRTFFEVAIIDDEGRRFEFHHIDAVKMTMDIRGAIITNKRIEAGTVVGHVVSRELNQFGILYDHIHYNVIDKNGKYLNPFALSSEVKDEIPPKIKGVFYKEENTLAKCKLHNGEFLKSVKENTEILNPEYLVFEAEDYLSNNKIAQAVTIIDISYDQGDVPNLTYDFSKGLELDFDIREIYYGKFCIGDPAYPLNLKGSVNTKFYYKVPLPLAYDGGVTVSVYDFKGNKTVKSFKISYKDLRNPF